MTPDTPATAAAAMERLAEKWAQRCSWAGDLTEDDAILGALREQAAAFEAERTRLVGECEMWKDQAREAESLRDERDQSRELTDMKRAQLDRALVLVQQLAATIEDSKPTTWAEAETTLSVARLTHERLTRERDRAVAVVAAARELMRKTTLQSRGGWIVPNDDFRPLKNALDAYDASAPGGAAEPVVQHPEALKLLDEWLKENPLDDLRARVERIERGLRYIYGKKWARGFDEDAICAAMLAILDGKEPV